MANFTKDNDTVTLVGMLCGSGMCATGNEEALKVNDNNQDNRDEDIANWEVATLAAMFVVAVFGNSLVVTALYLRRYGKTQVRKKSSSRMYFFILHLSIADLITAFLNVLPQLFWEITYRFQGGPILCKLVKFGQPLGPYLSSYVLMVTALDRYQAICHPLNYCSVTSRRSKIMVYLAWGLSLALCVPQLVVFSYQEASPGVWDCWGTFYPPLGERAYVTWFSITAFILPLLVLGYTNVSICLAIWRNTGIAGEARGTDGTLLRQGSVISRAKINSIKQMIAVISFYAASSSPFVASLLWVTWDPGASSSPFFEGAAFAILTLMSSLNSCVNPWIYLTLNPELPRALFARIYSSRRSVSYATTREGRRRCVCGYCVDTSSKKDASITFLFNDPTATETPCNSSGSSTGTSVESYASRMSRYAYAILGKSDTANSKEFHCLQASSFRGIRNELE